jgi:hypothetical protein
MGVKMTNNYHAKRLVAVFKLKPKDIIPGSSVFGTLTDRFSGLTLSEVGAGSNNLPLQNMETAVTNIGGCPQPLK